jgi:NAD+ synthase
MKNKAFHRDILKIGNVEKLVDQITAKIKEDIYEKLRRSGGVVGISGGIDSSVTLALTARALGPQKVLGIIMPEKDSSPESRELATGLAQQLGIRTVVEEITGALEGSGCYERRDRAVQQIFPEYDPSLHKMKIGIKQSSPSSHLPPVFHITVVNPDGTEMSKRMPSKEMRTIIAASNIKQRTRMSMLYYHAESNHYAVVGTPNKHEVDQGFFVKFGDGGSDLFPIGHLYKSQVYQVAGYLNIPREIIHRVPTTDTYSAEQTQEEFFYQFPFDQLDLLWYGFVNNHPPAAVGKVMGMTEEEVSMIYLNFARKKETTEYLRMQVIHDYDFL